MKKNLIIYNAVLLLVTNLLAINIPLSHDHNESHNEGECLECLYREANSNYILHDNHLVLSCRDYNIFLYEIVDKIKFSANPIYRSRAPPIS